MTEEPFSFGPLELVGGILISILMISIPFLILL